MLEKAERKELDTSKIESLIESLRQEELEYLYVRQPIDENGELLETIVKKFDIIESGT
ncbi:hypothetical protein V6R21_02035 [Limibacter armeniacum]|uniref:hypothetical protein n=1 Tax=Limibacter armeniacum TaxID=466084 RepID=UPI002FE54F5D